ncbi:MAG TPA: NUDIX domain-containing protein [Kiritimatiellia bacterium]|nr:NUDIX domain-containing protein [Kiritimatiellia bacterium]
MTATDHSTSAEIFDLVNEHGEVIGQAPRRECHGNPSLIHQAVHVFIFNHRNHLFLQKRSLAKDIQPGRWDTSVGGHLQPGESAEAGALRETREELGITPRNVTFAYQFFWRSPLETELIRTFLLRHDGPFSLDPAEIDEGRFWSPDEIHDALGTRTFTPQFEHEYPRLLDWIHHYGVPS